MNAQEAETPVAPASPAPLSLYLDVVNSQLATALWPAQPGTAQMTALFSRRILSHLIVEQQGLPAYQAVALAAYGKLLEPFTTLLPDERDGNELAQSIRRHVSLAPDYAKAEAAIQQAAVLLSHQNTAASRDLLQQIAQIELDLERAVQAATQGVAASPDAANACAGEVLSDAQKQNLRDVIRCHFSDESALEIGSLKPVAGGFSKQTVFVQLLQARALPEWVVLRSDRSDSPVGSTVADEFHLIRTLHAADVPVPRPYLLETDRAAIGGAFLIVDRVDGSNIGDVHDVSLPSREFGLGLARALARLHAIEPERFGSAIPGALISTRERMLADIDAYEARWRSFGVASISLEIAYAWLRKHIALAEGQRSLIHQDVGCHNILAANGELTALLDWETAAIGNPAQDLGYAYHTVEQLLPWRDFLAEYVRAGGTAPSKEQIAYYRLWRAAWVTPLVMQAKVIFESRASSSVGLAYGATFNLQRMNLALRQALCAVLR